MASSSTNLDKSQTTEPWKEFEEALASGEDVDTLLGLEDKEMETQLVQKKSVFEESMKVVIGGEEFKLELSTPTLDEIQMKKAGTKKNIADELLVPPPSIPLSEVLPLHAFASKSRIK